MGSWYLPACRFEKEALDGQAGNGNEFFQPGPPIFLFFKTPNFLFFKKNRETMI
jgi:hypothetical protein